MPSPWLALLRRRRLSLIVLASLLVVGVLTVTGVPWQLFNVLALMLLLGVGIDYGIFLQEHEDDPHAWLAVVIGAGSTWLSFGLLGLPLVLVLAPLFRSDTDTTENKEY